MPAERFILLQRVAQAQIDAGEPAAAAAILSRLTDAGQPVNPQFDNPQLAGGGVVVDFSQLTYLIQNVTEGPWLDIDGVGGTLAPYNTGVLVNPLGQMAVLSKADATGRLRDLAASARKADLNGDMAAASEMRVVSLTRLEQAVADRLSRGDSVPASMAHLAGLTRVQYVFADDATGEILIAGPRRRLAVRRNRCRPRRSQRSPDAAARRPGDGPADLLQRRAGCFSVPDCAAASGPQSRAGVRRWPRPTERRCQRASLYQSAGRPAG